MKLLVKHRLRGDGRVWIDHTKTRVLRDTGGWYAVRSGSGPENARVLFRPTQDMIVIEHSGRFLRVLFKDGEATFGWQERPYHIASMVFGEIRVDQENRPVAQGSVTASGIRLDRFEPELLPIICALAWGLTLRSEELARDGFRGGIG